MATINLELRITEFGSIISKRIFLQEVTNRNEVENWLRGAAFDFIKLPNFPIQDSSLEVFALCFGVAGGTVTCEVLIDGISKGRVVARAEDTSIISKIFTIQNDNI